MQKLYILTNSNKKKRKKETQIRIIPKHRTIRHKIFPLPLSLPHRCHLPHDGQRRCISASRRNDTNFISPQTSLLASSVSNPKSDSLHKLPEPWLRMVLQSHRCRCRHEHGFSKPSASLPVTTNDIYSVSVLILFFF